MRGQPTSLVWDVVDRGGHDELEVRARGLVDTHGPVNPATTNVKYVQHGAVAGVAEPWDGYLTYVPSLAECDTVEEGWTLDTAKTPPVVRVCPTACSCATTQEAMFMVEQGCPRHETK